MGHSFLNLQVSTQPNDTACGPTCLHSVYRFFGHDLPLDQLIEEIPPLPDGGTLAVQLGCHALENGLAARLYTNNLQMFDPTWFGTGADLPVKLRAQATAKQEEKLVFATSAYLKFLELGGTVLLESITPRLIRKHLDMRIPMIAGLSATYLYECSRELTTGEFDDVGGHPTGHFVLIHGYDQETDEVKVADPLPDNPPFESCYYTVKFRRLLTAIALGIITYDANILVVAPKDQLFPTAD